MITTVAELEEVLTCPSDADREALAALDGDLLILGVGGKMGPTLALRARRAAPAGKRIIAVARFSEHGLREQLEAGGVECILGARDDPVFGPVVMFGLGGAFVEVLHDVSIRVAPLTREDAMAMVREVRAFPLLDGARGRPKCDLDALADALLALSRLAMAARGTLDSIDVNPFVAFAKGAGPGGVSALALDAVVIGQDAR